MTLHGAVVDPAYSRMLIQKTDLALPDILALDRNQKQLPVDGAMVKRLHQAKLIEGRKPHLHVSAAVAAATSSEADYIRTRAQDDAFYIKMVSDYLTKFGSATRKDLDKLLGDKLSDALNAEQKRRKIGNLLTGMRNAGTIKNAGSRQAPVWTKKA